VPPVIATHSPSKMFATPPRAPDEKSEEMFMTSHLPF
jgi:hypothetical protein